MLVSIRPGIGQVDFSGIGTHVGECVKYVCKFISGKVLRIEVTCVDGLLLEMLVVSGMGLRDLIRGTLNYPVDKVRYVLVPSGGSANFSDVTCASGKDS